MARGRTYADPSIGLELRGTAGPDLTPREAEVLRHVALGRSNREIAASLGVGEETIKTHVTHLLAKLEVDNRAQAAVQAIARGLVTLEDLS